MSLFKSNSTYTCIPCRFSAKRTYVCPYCREPMLNMGKSFKPPRKSNDSQWQKIALIVEHDIRFGYCKCHRGQRILNTVSQAKNFVGQKKSAKKNYAEATSPREKQIAKRKEWIANR